MSLQEFGQSVEEYADRIESWKGVVQIGYANYADALIAASLLGRTFYELEQPFVIFRLGDQNIEDQLRKRENGPFILLGVEFDQINDISIDHETISVIKPIREEVASEKIINSGQFGYLIPEVSIASITYLLCDPIAPSITEIIKLPLIATQTINMMSEFQGINDVITQHASTEGIIDQSKKMGILGSDIFNIIETLVYSQIPFLPGLTGNEDRVSKLLAKSGVVIETSDGPRKLSDLDTDEIKDLNSTLIVHLSEYKGHQEDKLEFIKTKTIFVDEEKQSIVRNCWDYARAVIDAINRNRQEEAIAVLIGNRSDHLRELTKIYKEERRALPISFNLLVDKRDEIIDLKALRYLKTDKKINWYNTSVAAAMGLSNGLVTVDLPFAVVAPGPEKMWTIGIRASKKQNIGPGLKQLLDEVRDERNLDVNITGSRLSAQVSIPKDDVENVILDLNDKLGEYQ